MQKAAGAEDINYVVYESEKRYNSDGRRRKNKI